MLERFGPATQDWFRGAFPAPTPAQAGAWDAISAGKHALVVAPDRIGQDAVGVPLGDRPGVPREGCRAPGNRRSDAGPKLPYPPPASSTSPPEGAGRRRRAQPALAARRHRAVGPALGHRRARRSRSGVRSGDTTSTDRRKLVTDPPDILITTPESLYLMLTSQAGETLRGRAHRDHRRGARGRGHQARRAPRREPRAARRARSSEPAQRIGLSATVRPIDEVARFLGGSAPVEIVAPPRVEDLRLRSSSRWTTCSTRRPRPAARSDRARQTDAAADGDGTGSATAPTPETPR